MLDINEHTQLAALLTKEAKKIHEEISDSEPSKVKAADLTIQRLIVNLPVVVSDFIQELEITDEPE